MPVSYTISTDDKLVLVTATGVVTRDDMDDFRAQLLVDPRICPGTRLILEATDVDSRLTFADLQVIAGRLEGIFSRGISKVAVVADSRYAYSLAKTFAVFAANEPVRMKPFRNREVALEWLDTGVAPSADDAEHDIEPQSLVERDDSLVEISRRRKTPRSVKRAT